MGKCELWVVVWCRLIMQVVRTRSGLALVRSLGRRYIMYVLSDCNGFQIL